jgi:maltose/moltooligosaccharide transporter
VPLIEEPAKPAETDPRPVLPLDCGPHAPSVVGRVRRWLASTRPEFQIGTLRYTGFGLIMVFVWLLWGDFCFTLLDQNIPNLLPIKLNQIGAGDTTNSILNGTIAYAVTFFLAPIVSVRSDRTRSRWGRRIPYLFWSTPFVGLFLVLIGCYDSITNALIGNANAATILGIAVSRSTLSLIVIGTAIVGWDLANIFVNTIYYYLFNDVVPPAYISRFLALFRIVFLLVGMGYNKWIYGHGIEHFRMIFVVAGIAYGVGFLLMCLFVREGDYPPPPADDITRGRGMLASIITYAQECFTHRLYWYFFLANACVFSARLTGMFIGVRNLNTLKLTMQQTGDYFFWYSGVALLLQFPAGWLADKFHPLRVYLLASVWGMLGTAAQCVWIFHDFGPAGNLRYMYVTGLMFMPLLVVAEAAELPMYMRLLPRDRYGQFASANAMVRAFVRIFLSVAAGAFIGWMGRWYGERRYTWVAGWQLFFQVLAAVFLILLYRQWKRHGGDMHYTPPQTVFPQGFPIESAAAQ